MILLIYLHQVYIIIIDESNIIKFSFSSICRPIILLNNDYLILYSRSVGIKIFNISLKNTEPSLNMKYGYNSNIIPYYFTDLQLCISDTNYPYLLGITLNKELYYTKIDKLEWVYLNIFRNIYQIIQKKYL